VASPSILFRDLKRLVSSSSQQQQNTRKEELLARLRNKPFWIWSSKEEHKQENIRTGGECYFNHIIGLPQKEGIDKPLYDYEQLIFQLKTYLDKKSNRSWCL
jgi:hypothetical protein